MQNIAQAAKTRQRVRCVQFAEPRMLQPFARTMKASSSSKNNGEGKARRTCQSILDQSKVRKIARAAKNYEQDGAKAR